MLLSQAFLSLLHTLPLWALPTPSCSFSKYKKWEYQLKLFDLANKPQKSKCLNTNKTSFPHGHAKHEALQSTWHRHLSASLMVAHFYTAVLQPVQQLFPAKLHESSSIDVLVHGVALRNSTIYICPAARADAFACCSCTWHQCREYHAVLFWRRCISSERRHGAKNRDCDGSIWAVIQSPACWCSLSHSSSSNSIILQGRYLLHLAA